MIGLIGKKLGMTQVFIETGELIPVTVIEAIPNTVIRKKTKETDGYNACVLGAGEMKKPNHPYAGVFKKSGVKPTKILYEIRDLPSDWELRKEITLSIFKVSANSKVNVTASSKGKGFQGVMKRHGFHGGPGGHGSGLGRSTGSIGTSKTPGKVYKGRKMPGRMGNQKMTVRNLKVIKIDEAKNLLFLKGQVPGAKNSWVLVKQK